LFNLCLINILLGTTNIGREKNFELKIPPNGARVATGLNLGQTKQWLHSVRSTVFCCDLPAFWLLTVKTRQRCYVKHQQVPAEKLFIRNGAIDSNLMMCVKIQSMLFFPFTHLAVTVFTCHTFIMLELLWMKTSRVKDIFETRLRL